MKIISVFPSGRVLDKTDLGEKRLAELAEEFPTINYCFATNSYEVPAFPSTYIVREGNFNAF